MSDGAPRSPDPDFITRIPIIPESAPEPKASIDALRFTETKPTESGWYWINELERINVPEIGEVFKGFGKTQELGFRCNGSLYFVDSLKNSQWAGPIPEPVFLKLKEEKRDLKLTKKHIEILFHTQNRAANGRYCGDSTFMQDLVQMGFMVLCGKVSFVPDEYFQLTRAGHDIINKIRNCGKENKMVMNGKVIDDCEHKVDGWCLECVKELHAQTVNEWAAKIHAYAIEKGWWPEGEERNKGEIFANFHSELSEAWELVRDGREVTKVWFEEDEDGLKKPEGISVELVDCIIRILDYLFASNMDVEEILKLKHKYNLKRPFRHGGKTA